MHPKLKPGDHVMLSLFVERAALAMLPALRQLHPRLVTMRFDAFHILRWPMARRSSTPTSEESNSLAIIQWPGPQTEDLLQDVARQRQLTCSTPPSGQGLTVVSLLISLSLQSALKAQRCRLNGLNGPGDLQVRIPGRVRRRPPYLCCTCTLPACASSSSLPAPLPCLPGPRAATSAPIRHSKDPLACDIRRGCRGPTQASSEAAPAQQEHPRQPLHRRPAGATRTSTQQQL